MRSLLMRSWPRKGTSPRAERRLGSPKPLDALKRILVAVGLFAGSLLWATAPAEAAFRVTVTKGEGFSKDAVSRVAVVTHGCTEVVDCSNIERRTISELAGLKLPFEIVPEVVVRRLYFDHGIEEYTAETRAFLIEELKLDGLIELSIPFAQRGAGFGGRHRSESRVEAELLHPDGTILFRGIGTGRPKNVVSSPEKVTANLVKRIFKEVY